VREPLEPRVPVANGSTAVAELVAGSGDEAMVPQGSGAFLPRFSGKLDSYAVDNLVKNLNVDQFVRSWVAAPLLYRSLEDDPASVDAKRALIELVAHLSNLGREDVAWRAIREFGRSAALTELELAILMLDHAATDEKRITAALKVIDLAENRDQTCAAYRELAKGYDSLGRLPDALIALRRLVDLGRAEERPGVEAWMREIQERPLKKSRR